MPAREYRCKWLSLCTPITFFYGRDNPKRPFAMPAPFAAQHNAWAAARNRSLHGSSIIVETTIMKSPAKNRISSWMLCACIAWVAASAIFFATQSAAQSTNTIHSLGPCRYRLQRVRCSSQLRRLLVYAKAASGRRIGAPETGGGPRNGSIHRIRRRQGR